MSHKSEEANVQFRNTCPSAGNLFTKSVLILLATLLLSTAGQAETVTNYGPISNSPSNQIRPGQVVWADLQSQCWYGSDQNNRFKQITGLGGWLNYLCKEMGLRDTDAFDENSYWH
jgi:hypothetical protein